MSYMLYTYKEIRNMKIKSTDKIIRKYEKDFDKSSPLYQFIMDDDKMYDLIYTASMGKRKRPDVKEVLGPDFMDKEFCLNNKNTRMYRTIIYLRIMVLSRSYVPCDFMHHSIKDGTNKKTREILVPDFINDLLIQYLAVEMIRPVIDKIHFTYSCASFPGKGRIYARNYIEGVIHKNNKKIKRARKKVKSDPIKYYLKLDVRHFFPSIKHRELKKKFKERIRDKEILAILFRIIDSTDYGIPIGFYSSQWFANFLLTDLDHYIKERIAREGKAVGNYRNNRVKNPGIKIYCRYMDDMVLFSSNKELLHRVKNEIESELNKLGLELKDNWVVALFDCEDKDYIKKHGYPTKKERRAKPGIGRKGHALDFIGYRFFREYTILRKSTYKNIIKFLNQVKNLNGGEISLKQAYQLISYYGLLKWTNVNLYANKIKEVVSVKDAKRKIRMYQLRQNAMLKSLNAEYSDRETKDNSNTDEIYNECVVNYLHSVRSTNYMHTGMPKIRNSSQYFKHDNET